MYYKTLRKKYILLLLLLMSLLLVMVNLSKKGHKTQININKESGFYATPFLLEMSCEEGLKLYYTLDGTEPSINSDEYKEPIYLADATPNANVYANIKNVSYSYYDEFSNIITASSNKYQLPNHNILKSNVLKVIVVDSSNNILAKEERTYFVGLNDNKALDGLYTVSLTMNPDDLFDYKNGIYVLGEKFEKFIKNDEDYVDSDEYEFGYLYGSGVGLADANYYGSGKKWTRDGNIEIFDNDKNIVYTSNVQVKINGGWSRQLYPRSLKLVTQKDDILKNDLNLQDEGMILFAGGSDVLFKMRDYMICELLNDSDSTMIHHNYNPCSVFINGEYWGVYYISDVFSSNSIGEKYDINPYKIVHEKSESLVYDNNNNHLFKNVDSTYPGYFEKYLDDLIKLEGTDLWNKVNKGFDIENLVDYYALNVYINNFDCIFNKRNNVEVFKTSINTGEGINDDKWRFMLFDLNSAMESERDILPEAIEGDDLFAKLFEIDDFKVLFINRVKYYANEVFSSAKMEKFIDMYDVLMRDALKENSRRFYNDDLLNQYEDYLDFFRYFSKVRYDLFWDSLSEIVGEEWLVNYGIQK